MVENQLSQKRQRRVVSFDVGNTLLEPYPSVGQVYVEVARRFTSDPIPAEAVEAAFYREWRRRGRHFDYSRESWRELVRAVYRGIHPIGEDPKYFQVLYEHFAGQEPWRIRSGTWSILRQLRQLGFRLAIVSNWDSRLERVLRDLGLYGWFEVVLISEQVGYQKPDLRIFRELQRRLQVPARQIYHIGDAVREDYWAAREAGFQSILLDPRGEYPWIRPRIRCLRELTRWLLLKEKRERTGISC